MMPLVSLKGMGWLRTVDSGSAIAGYTIDIARRGAGSQSRILVTHGLISSEPWALIVAHVQGKAKLKLETGELIDIQVIELGRNDDTADFVIRGYLPLF